MWAEVERNAVCRNAELWPSSSQLTEPTWAAAAVGGADALPQVLLQGSWVQFRQASGQGKGGTHTVAMEGGRVVTPARLSLPFWVHAEGPGFPPRNTDSPYDFSVQARITQIGLPPLQVLGCYFSPVINTPGPTLELKLWVRFTIKNVPFLPVQASSRQESLARQREHLRTLPSPHPPSSFLWLLSSDSLVSSSWFRCLLPVPRC